MPSVVCRHERGNISLYVAVIIPVVVSLAVLAFDVSRYQLLRETAQREADRIALAAAQALPNIEQAERVVLESAAALRGLNIARAADQTPLLNVSGSRVSLTLEGNVSAVFDLFLRIGRHTGQVFAVRESSEAQIVPGDYVLIVSDAVSLRPRPGEAWGSGALWPPSNYFSLVEPPEIKPSGESVQLDQSVYWDRWWEHWKEPRYRRWATQACYNPLYSPIKFAAISLVDVLGAVQNNRLSLLFTPGEDPNQGFAVSRPLDFVRSGGDEAQARWLDYFETPTFVSDESCVYFADPATSQEDTYSLPRMPASFAEASAAGPACRERFNPLRNGQGYYYPVNTLSSCFTEQSLRLREAIYFHAARSTAHWLDGSNIIEAVNQAYLQLLVSSPEGIESARINRGNLAVQARRKIVVLSDILPRPSSPAFQEMLSRIREANIELVLVLFLPEEIESSCSDYLLRKGNFDRLLGEYDRLEAGKARAVAVHSGRELADVIIPRIIGASRELAIRS